MIQARVKQEYRYGKSLLAFSRHEFMKDEWRDVPAGSEDEARAHEWLEVRDRPVVEEGAIETLAPAPEVEAVTDVTPESEKLLDKMLEGEEGEEAVTPTADKLLDELLEDQPDEEVKKTRRGRGGKRG